MRERADLNQYNVAFDIQRFTALMVQRGTVGFETSLAIERAYIGQQLKTDIGERLDVAKSTFVYEIRERKLYEPGRNEPFEEVIKKGMGRNPIDAQRDAAELGSFTGVIQGFLAKEDTADGTTVLAVSPRGLPGSYEKKNFFQVYVREGNYIIGTRYFSDLTNEDYRRKIISINPAYSTLIPEKPTDVDLKSNPMVIPSYLDYSADPDRLARFILGRKIGMPKEELDQIFVDIAPVWTSYINTLVENPQALEDLETGYVANLNAAYKTSERVLEQKFPNYGELAIDGRVRATNFNWTGTRIEIQMLANEPVKIGGGACGSGSCSTSISSSSDVPSSELDNLDGRGDLHFRCPKCKTINKRELFQYVTNCQKCGSDEVLPPNLRGMVFQPGQKLKQ